MAENDQEELLLKQVEDITDDWVVRLLPNIHHVHHYNHPPSGVEPRLHLRKWSREESSNTDTLAGFSSTRATISVEYEVEGEMEGEGATTAKRLRKEYLLVKVIPTEGHMANVLTSEGMHHAEVDQYGRFLRALGAWEAERRSGVGVIAEIVPAHALAVSTENHFTLVLPDIIHLGYQMNTVEEGLSEEQVLAVASKIGNFQGTVVAYKVMTNTSLQTAFPRCFHQPRVDSQVFSVFAKAGFDRLRQEWSGEARMSRILELLETYEAIADVFVVSNLRPREPFATALHGDLQPSNIFFKHNSQGQLTLKLIDWATARYSQGPVDLVYLLNVGVSTQVRRKVTQAAKDAYFEGFNAALTELNANMSYPREVFEQQFLKCRQLMVIWSVMCFNLFLTTEQLRERLVAILSDVLFDAAVPSPQLSSSDSSHSQIPST